MSPASAVATQLRHLIYYNLDNNNLRNALFVAGRLHGLEPRSPEAAYLLALCHLRLGEIRVAYDYCRVPGSRGMHLGCAFVFAQACLALGKYSEGITALDKCRGLWQERNSWNKHNETRRQHMPDAPTVYCLLGKLYQAHEESHRAVDSYSAALKANPFMWDAFLGLCDLGVNVRIPAIFQLTPEMVNCANTPSTEDIAASTGTVDSPPLGQLSKPANQSKPDPFNSTSIPQNNQSIRNGKVPLYEKLNGSHISITPLSTTIEIHGNDRYETPTNPSALNGSVKETQILDEEAAPEPPQAPARRRGLLTGLDEAISRAPVRSKHGGFLTRAQNGTEPEDNGEGSQVPVWNPTGMADRKRTASGQVSKASFAPTRTAAGTATDAGSREPQRRSGRLADKLRPQTRYTDVGSIHKSMSTRESGRELKRPKAGIAKAVPSQQMAGRVVSGNSRTKRAGDPMDVDGKEARAIVPSGAPLTAPKPSQLERVRELDAIRTLLELFTKLGSAHFAMSQYSNEEALVLLKSLDERQLQTPWVQTQMGRVLLEMTRYADAEKHFARARQLCPSRLKGLEYHSTVLWQLKAEVDLAHLAHEATDVDRLSPEAWCVLGNSLSLDRNHEKALAAFTRATQLDPTFAYAYTLQGHEHVANEEYDKALASYRASMTANPRHYNAYYGLGRVYEKQGKYDDAERHYRIAASINPTNSVLICCIGTVLEKLKRPQLALDYYSRSCDLAPKSILSRFRKATILMVLNQWEAALDNLLILKDVAPDEANVHFHLGRTYKTLKMKAEAIKHFTAALNLDPKASHRIKEAMEEMEEYDEDDYIE